MSHISFMPIPQNSKTNKTAGDYCAYLNAYRTFSVAKQQFAPGSTVKVDSQFSEALAADLFGFDINHQGGFDGVDPNTGDTYEVKGTGFHNNRVRFNSDVVPNHVIWIKVTKKEVIATEIKLGIYQSLQKGGFITLNLLTDSIPGTLKKYRY